LCAKAVFDAAELLGLARGLNWSEEAKRCFERQVASGKLVSQLKIGRWRVKACAKECSIQLSRTSPKLKESRSFGDNSPVLQVKKT
jgi:hypothetical protein